MSPAAPLKRWKFGPAISALVICAGLGGCDRDAPSSRGAAGSVRDGVAVTLGSVVHRPIERSIEVTGTLFGEEETTVSAKLSGRVIDVFKDIGDRAEQDSVLGQIDPKDYQLALEQERARASASLAELGLSQLPDDTFDPETLPKVEKARAEASNAQAKFERARRLFEQAPPLLSEQDYADIRTAWEVARNEADVEQLSARATLADARAQAATVAVAEQRLADCVIKAPVIDERPTLVYRVGERMVSVGEYVNESKPLFRLVATDILKFKALVPERYAGQVQPGQIARVATEGEGAPITGSVTRVSPTIDAQSRTFIVEIKVENADQRLKPGGFGRASIVLRTDSEAIFVPREAMISFAGISKVFSVKDAKAVEHRVTPGTSVDGMIEIRGAFDAEQVVTSNAAALAQGTPVTVGAAAKESPSPTKSGG